MRLSVLTLALFGAFVGLFMTALPASAALTANLIVAGDFTEGTITGVNSPISLSSGIWYTSQTESPATNTWQISSLAAMTQTTGSLIQAVNSPTASYGPVEFSFYYRTGIASYATATLFGSSTQPTYGIFGTELGSIVLSQNHALSDGPVTETFGAFFPGYAWYTAIFYGQEIPSNKIYVDGVSLKVTEGAPVPLPGAVWLLGSALVGLAGMRRFRKK